MRVFVAVPMPEEIREKLGALGKEIDQDGINLVMPQNMHLTLKFIGEVSDTMDIEEKLKAVKFQKFECNVKKIGVFPNEKYIRVVWGGVEGVDNLAKQVIETLQGYGKQEQFSGHATIARVKIKIDIKEFLEKHKDEDIGNFTVSKFEQIQSVLGKDGPEYATIATFAAEQ